MIVNLDLTQGLIFIFGLIFGIGIYVARNEYAIKQGNDAHEELEGRINRILIHFNLTEGLEPKDLKTDKKRK